MIRIFFLPRRARVLASLGFLGVFASVVAYAQLGGSSGVVLPYIGHLEKDGVALDSLGVDVRFRFTLWNAPTGGTACGAQYLEEAPVSAGRFAVEIGPVAESCVVAREVYLGVEVDEGDGFVALAGRQRVVPALAASTSGTGDLYVAEDVVVDGALDVGGALGVVGAVEVGGDVDVDGNVDVGGDVVANGDGIARRLRLSSTGDLSVANGESPALRIGPSNGTNLALDNNEIMARSNGAASDLYLNYEGGTVHVGTADSELKVRGRVATVDLTTTGVAKGFARGGGQVICDVFGAIRLGCVSWGTGGCDNATPNCGAARKCTNGTVTTTSGSLRCYHDAAGGWNASCASWVCLE